MRTNKIAHCRNSSNTQSKMRTSKKYHIVGKVPIPNRRKSVKYDTTHVYIYMAGSFLAGYMHFNKILQKNKKISLHLKAYCIHRYALVNCIGNEEVKACSNTKMSSF